MSAAAHPFPQSQDDMMRECMGTIARVCQDMERCAMNGDEAGLIVHFNFIKAQMNRLDTIQKTVRPNRREL